MLLSGGPSIISLATEFPGRVDVMHRTGPRSLGRSYLQGMRRALQTDAAVVCQMDADLSHDPQYLPAMLEATADYDLVIGSRFLHGVSVVNWPLRRLFLSTFGNRYIRLVTGLPVRDCTSGYRCWRRDALARIPIDRVRSEGYAHLVEMLSESAMAGCRIAEVPIIFIERRQGTSKLSFGILIESLITPWRMLFRRLARAGGRRA